jgi:VanZ family protein
MKKPTFASAFLCASNRHCRTGKTEMDASSDTLKPLRWRRFGSYRAAFVLALLATTIACLLPGDALLSPPIPHLDKIVHASAWAVIALCATTAFALHRHARWLALGLLLWSLAIEWLQQYVPNRSFEWADLCANGIGVVAGIVLARVIRHLPVVSSFRN